MATTEPARWSLGRAPLCAAPALVLLLASPSAFADEPPKSAGATVTDASNQPAARAAAPPAQPAEVEEPPWENQKPQRRGGFTAGFAGGVSLGMASGYPLDVKKIGRQSYYTQSDIGVGGTGILWVGGALTDWLTFGLGASGEIFSLGDGTATGVGFVFHIDTFPLLTLGGRWRDVGVMLDAGASMFTLTPSSDDKQILIDGGAASHLGGGVFFESMRFWKVGTGPYLHGSYMWSDSVRHGMVTLGWRVSLYTSP